MFWLMFFWSLAYIFAIIHAITYKRHAIPPFAISINFAWEIVASLMYGGWVQIAWTFLDVFIVALLIKELKRNSKFIIQIVLCFLSFIGYAVLCYLVFPITFNDGMSGFVLLSFVMDLVMAVLYCIELIITKWANGLFLYVSMFKLIGDCLAWILFRTYLTVNILGIFVLCINSIFVVAVAFTWRNNYKKKKMELRARKHMK